MKNATHLKLNRLRSMTAPKGPVVLAVLDGIGIGRPDETNAIHLARTPTLDLLTARFPHTQLRAHGPAVGLPTDQDMGNSEVGHNALGAGRVFDQGAKLVNKALQTGSLWRSDLWAEIMARCDESGALHFIGLLSDGNVHSHIDHLFALLDGASSEGIRRVRVHPLLDGRDVPATSALEYIRRLEGKLAAINGEGFDYRIASGGGRMVTTMDRYEADWNIVRRGWDAHVLGKGRAFPDAETAIATYRREEMDLSDQYIPPFVIAEGDSPVGPVRDGDAVVLFNFRGDRAIEISRAFEEEQFDAFERSRVPDVLYAGMMEYDGDRHIPKRFLVHPPAIDRTISAYLVSTGVKQLAVAETQKFGHVTYFWNGNRSGKFSDDLETYLEVRSDQVPFEQRPWMKAAEVTDRVLSALESREYRFIRVNYANGDMVGHTGKMDAAVIAVESVDLCLARLWQKVRGTEGVLVVTADHGNADQMYQMSKDGAIMLDERGVPRPLTSHTLNPVVFLIADERKDPEYRMDPPDEAGLSNVAATVLNLLGYEEPEDYDQSLIQTRG